MKRTEITKCIAFLLLFLVLLTGISYAVRMNGDVKDRFVGFYAEKRNTLDAVLIGSSPVYPAFATPEIYGEQGIAVYPLSSNMQRPKAAVWLTREALKYQDPALMIYEVRMFTMRDEELLGNMAHTREVTDNLRYSVNRLQAIRALVEDPDERLTYDLDIFKYHSNWKTLALPSQLKTCFYAWPEGLKGHEPLTDVGPAEGTLPSAGTDIVPIPEEEEQALTELCAYLREMELKALFVVVPHTTKMPETDAQYRYLSQLVTAQGFAFLNMNDLAETEMGIDPDCDFRDYGNHLNAVGAGKLSGWFGRYLKEQYGLPDHRGDTRYASWDAAYAKWQEEYGRAEQLIGRHVAEGSYYVVPEEE